MSIRTKVTVWRLRESALRQIVSKFCNDLSLRLAQQNTRLARAPGAEEGLQVAARKCARAAGPVPAGGRRSVQAPSSACRSRPLVSLRKMTPITTVITATMIGYHRP